MAAQCEATRLTRAWDRKRCKRNATTTVGERMLCEQHAKIALGLPADVNVWSERPEGGDGWASTTTT